MSKETYHSGKRAQSTRGKRRGLPLLVFSITLVLVVSLFGCGPKPEPEPVISPVVEEVFTETTEPAPTNAPPAWCSSGSDLYALLPSVEDAAAAGTTVELCIPGGEGYTIEIFDVIPDGLEDTKSLTSTFEINALLTYFKVKNAGAVVTSFDPAMIMRITYTYDAWQDILEREFAAPRIAYLPWTGDGWAEEWVEFVIEEENIYPPEGVGSDGYIIIEIDGLPDPLIGDC